MDEVGGSRSCGIWTAVRTGSWADICSPCPPFDSLLGRCGTLSILLAARLVLRQGAGVREPDELVCRPLDTLSDHVPRGRMKLSGSPSTKPPSFRAAFSDFADVG
jgi:hypothetical protein